MASAPPFSIPQFIVTHFFFFFFFFANITKSEA